MATYVCVHTEESGRMIFRRVDKGVDSPFIRVWPMYDRPDGETYYKAQDGFLHVWEMDGKQLQDALRNGIEHP